MPPISRASSPRVSSRTWVGAVAVFFALLSLAGITMSSIGYLSAGPGDGVLAGKPRTIRADEFVRTSPWRIGLTETGDDAFASPLGGSQMAQVTNDGDASWTSVLIFDNLILSRLGSVAPTVAFALVWWLPIALVIALLPVFLRRFGVAFAIGMPATALIVIAPASAWWSWAAMPPLGWSLVAALALLGGGDRVRRSAAPLPTAGLAVLAAFALARTAVSAYTPWIVPVAGFVLLPALALMLQPRAGRGRVLALLAVVVAVAAVLLGLFLWENREALATLTQTVYPGTRRAGGESVPWGLLLGAPFLAITQLDSTPLLGGINQSELAGSFLILALPAAVLATTVGWRRQGRLAAAALVDGALLVVLLAWSTLDWPTWSAQLFPLSLSTGHRIGAVLGFGATIVFAFVLATWRAQAPADGRRTAMATACGLLVALGLSAAGYSLATDFLPDLSAGLVIAIGVAWGLAVAVLIRWSRWWTGLPIVALALVVTLAVNPVQVGFGSVQTGPAATAMRQQGPGRWASDAAYVDALFMANGIPSLTGQQWMGPDRDAWALLDPEERHSDVWNRGAAFISLQWAKPGVPTTFTNPRPEIIQVAIDPCNSALRSLGVTRISSARPLVGYECLTPGPSFDWVDRRYWTYSLGS